MTGYRIHIAPDDFQGTAADHYSGCGSVRRAAPVPCPNCGRPLFPVFHLSFGDHRLRDLGIWSRSSATVLVCPACALYMEPYFIQHDGAVSVTGGERDGGQVLQDVDYPYSCRLITLEPAPSAGVDAPRHQVGGEPCGEIRDLACPRCSRPMGFFGYVDYDDLNVPLYENGGSPVALVIGDGEYLALLSCVTCAVIGVHRVHGGGRPTRG